MFKKGCQCLLVLSSVNFGLRDTREGNMYLFSVVGSDRQLKITPQSQYEARSLILGANKTQGVVQGQHGVQHDQLGGAKFPVRFLREAGVWKT